MIWFFRCFVWIAQVFLGAAHAEAPPEVLPSDGPLAAISRGDFAWWTGDRRTAWREWRAALDLARASDGSASYGAAYAAEAMARVRLLQLGGSVAPFVHEAALNRALRACPDAEPWCWIAAADAELFMPRFTGADPARVPALLADSPLKGPAAARVAVATGATPEADPGLDGMGRGIVATGRPRPPGPGTWVLGVGVGGAPGAGVALQARFLHPDLGWKAHRLELTGGADTRGGAAASGTLVTATTPAWFAGVAGARIVADTWDAGERASYALISARVGGGVAPRVGVFHFQLGAWARDDILAGVPAPTAGPSLSVTAGNLLETGVRAGIDTGFGTYTHVGLSLDGRVHPSLAGGTLAARLGVTHVPTDSPFYRLPTAGGADLLRGLPAGRFRASTVAAGQVECRRPLIGPLEGAIFVDSAYAEGWHVTAGGGVRLVLPPARWNVTRLDVGVGPEGWGVVAAWGEAF